MQISMNHSFERRVGLCGRSIRQLRVDLRVGVRKPLLIVAVIWILRSCFRCPPLLP